VARHSTAWSPADVWSVANDDRGRSVAVFDRPSRWPYGSKPGCPALAAVTRFALRELAQRARYLDDQLQGIKLRLKRITEHVAPALTELKGVGPDASALLLAAGDNPERLANEQSFAGSTTGTVRSSV